MESVDAPPAPRAIARPADIAAAIVLGLLQPGLGQIYLGFALRSLVALAAVVVLLLLAGVAGLLSRFGGYVAAHIIVVNVYLALAIDAGSVAWRRGRVRTFYNRRFTFPIAAALLAGSLYALLRLHTPLFGFAVSRTPSGGMEPTLLIGDYILYDTRCCGADRPPERGDVVVFDYPADPRVSYVKRVAGAGGDRLQFTAGQLVRNGTAVDEPYRKGRNANMEPSVIPQGELYVLGDNRERSSDSRVWGTVKTSAVRGRVTCVLFSPSRERFGLPIADAWAVKATPGDLDR